MWEPDCTFAEAKAAYDASKTLVFNAGNENSVIWAYIEEDSLFYYQVLWRGNKYQDSVYDDLIGVNSYTWNASGVSQFSNSP